RQDRARTLRDALVQGAQRVAVALEQQGQAGILADAEVDQADYHAVLFEGDGDTLRALNQRIAQRPGAILAVHGLTSDALAAGAAYVPERLLTERSISVNTAAAGGNASLMTIG
ncbi:hypothetical protein ACOTEA_12230, partial [Achromobacter xylosoxidans]